jgi:hypothetical protein
MERETSKSTGATSGFTSGRTGLADSPPTEAGDLRLAIARAVASRKISDDAITAVAKKLSTIKQPIRGIDVCTHGICIDYFFTGDEWVKALPELIRAKDSRIYGVEIFPWGIPFPDIYRVRVQQDFPELGAQGIR